MSQPPFPQDASGSTFQTQCPHCGQAFAVPREQVASLSGQVFPCSRCGKTFTFTPGGASVGAAMPSPAGPIGYNSGQSTPKTNGLAIASLVSGVLLCIPFVPAIAAIILGIFGLKKSNEPNTGGKGLAVAGLSLGIVGILGWVGYFAVFAAILLPSLNRARETANRVKCASNMRQIGQAMLLYGNENQGAYPPRLEDLLLTQDITSEVFTCPSTNDTKAPGASGSAAAANLSTGGHLSFVYVGANQTTSAPSEAVLLYEPPTNHSGDGMNVLYGDGHVEFQTKNEANRIISELNAGHNPPRRPGDTSSDTTTHAVEKP